MSLPVTGAYVQELSGLDSVMTDWINKYGFQAVTLAVVRDRRLVYERGYGYQDKSLSKEILPHARMRLASTSICLTKRALRQLIEDGRLRNDNLVYKVLDLQPWIGDYADPQMKQITIADLIDDKSCLIDHAPSVTEIGQAMGLGRNPTLAESIQYMWSQPSTIRDNCTVGKTDSGSHYAMEIAGQIIAKAYNAALKDADPTAAGKSYGNYITSHATPGDTTGDCRIRCSCLSCKTPWCCDP